MLSTAIASQQDIDLEGLQGPDDTIDARARALPVAALRKARRALSAWLDQLLLVSAPGAFAASPEFVQALAAGSCMLATGSPLRQQLAEMLRAAEDLQRSLGGPVVPRASLVRRCMALIMRLADMEADWTAEQACLDPLTGLPGRRALEQRLLDEISRVRRGAGPCAIGLLDLDRFKDINDQHGHLIGDRYLAAFAASLGSGLRAHDAAYRFGGDEFALCFPHTSRAQAEAVLQRVRVRMARHALLHCGRHKLFGAFTAGVAELEPDRSVRHALDEADSRLYAGKRSGERALAPAA